MNKTSVFKCFLNNLWVVMRRILHVARGRPHNANRRASQITAVYSVVIYWGRPRQSLVLLTSDNEMKIESATIVPCMRQCVGPDAIHEPHSEEHSTFLIGCAVCLHCFVSFNPRWSHRRGWPERSSQGWGHSGGQYRYG
jgi:hypothetical protein